MTKERRIDLEELLRPFRWIEEFDRFEKPTPGFLNMLQNIIDEGPVAARRSDDVKEGSEMDAAQEQKEKLIKQALELFVGTSRQRSAYEYVVRQMSLPNLEREVQHRKEVLDNAPAAWKDGRN